MKGLFSFICFSLIAASPIFGQNQTASKQLTIKVLPAKIAIATVSLPDATIGQPYSAALSVTGGASPFSWSVVSGTLPAGLALTPSTGVISGTPSGAVGTSAPITFQVTDSSGAIASINLQWQPSSTQNVSYNVMRSTVSGGPYSKVATTTSLAAVDQMSRGQNQTRFYVIQAFNSAGTSANSNEAKAVIP